jgi:hypothetical protein
MKLPTSKELEKLKAFSVTAFESESLKQKMIINIIIKQNIFFIIIL